MTFFSFALFISLSVCLIGLIYRFQYWFRARIANTVKAFSGIGRFLEALENVIQAVFSGQIIRLFQVLFFDILLQTHLFKDSVLRWLMHMSIFYGVTILVLMHALDGTMMTRFFPDYASTLNPYLFLRNFFGVMIIAGIVIAAFRRIAQRKLRQITRFTDWTALLVLLAIVLSGFLLESVQIISPTIFDEMVDDYLMGDDEEEIAALRVYWVENFSLGLTEFETKSHDNGDERYAPELGKMIHEESCAGCHSKPTSAFVSYPLAQIILPASQLLDKLQIHRVLWYLHFLICFAGLGYLPFSKFFHMVSTPVNLLIADNKKAVPNSDTQRIIGLDACTHCGLCSIHCSVGPVYRIIGNRDILPSEKLESLKHWIAGERKQANIATFSQGSFICTGCYRCTSICPSKIDLQDLWDTSKAECIREGFSEPHVWIRRRRASEWAAYLKEMGDRKVEPFRHVNLTDRPETFRDCIQCTTCTSVCPVVAASDDPEGDFDFTPQQIMNLMRLQLKDLALGARMVWDCTTCYMCQEHCPQGVRVADVLYELRNIAVYRLKDCANKKKGILYGQKIDSDLLEI